MGSASRKFVRATQLYRRNSDTDNPVDLTAIRLGIPMTWIAESSSILDIVFEVRVMNLWLDMIGLKLLSRSTEHASMTVPQ